VRLAREVRYLHTRWASVLARDPAYNPNPSLAHETCPLAWPPGPPAGRRGGAYVAVVSQAA
jgi:O-antigen biosynthesis protein